MIWATTQRIGCHYRDGYGTICNYWPAGNIKNQRFAVIGPQCSKCPPDFPLCQSGLCAPGTYFRHPFLCDLLIYFSQWEPKWLPTIVANRTHVCMRNGPIGRIVLRNVARSIWFAHDPLYVSVWINDAARLFPHQTAKEPRFAILQVPMHSVALKPDTAKDPVPVAPATKVCLNIYIFLSYKYLNLCACVVYCRNGGASNVANGFPVWKWIPIAQWKRSWRMQSRWSIASLLLAWGGVWRLSRVLCTIGIGGLSGVSTHSGFQNGERYKCMIPLMVRKWIWNLVEMRGSNCCVVENVVFGVAVFPALIDKGRHT